MRKRLPRPASRPASSRRGPRLEVQPVMAQRPSHQPASTAASRLPRFDMRAFHAALDAARRAKGLSWAELAAQTNRPFEGTTSIPIHPATLRDMLAKRSVTSAVVLQALAWLGRAPEKRAAPGPGIELDASRSRIARLHPIHADQPRHRTAHRVSPRHAIDPMAGTTGRRLRAGTAAVGNGPSD